MRIAIFSDIHGNKQALESILNDIKKQKIDKIISLGDMIAIGPNSKECLDLAINNNIEMVLGNHELYYLKGTQIDEIDGNELKHQKWVKEQLDTNYYKFLNNFGLTIEKEFDGKKVLFEHFLINNESKADYPFYGLTIVKNEEINTIANKLNYDYVFIGHEHKNFTIENKVYDIGSSGCQKNNMTRYTIFDTKNFTIETKIIEYDRSGFIKNLVETDYPDRSLIAKWFFGYEFE